MVDTIRVTAYTMNIEREPNMTSYTVRFYVLEEDYLVGHGNTKADALAHANRTAATEASQDLEDLPPVARVVFWATATSKGHAAILNGFSAAPAMA